MKAKQFLQKKCLALKIAFLQEKPAPRVGFSIGYIYRLVF
jgi:hypothetical protein